jgi:inorganic pyrophosphatase
MSPRQELTGLPARDPDSRLVTVVVEAPKGSRVKFKYDEGLGLLRLDKVLPLGAAFPFDFGFVPSTRAEDGDPVDILVLADEPTFPGCVVAVRLIGVIEAEQTEDGKTVRNDRLVGVVETRYNSPDFHSLDELPPARLDEIEHFFAAYNEAEGRRFEPVGRRGPKAAERLIEGGVKQFRRSGGNGPEGDSRQGTEPAASSQGGKSGQLRGTEAGVKGALRIVRKQADKALEALAGDQPPSDEAVHNARKRLKKARAGLRLLRPALGRRAYDREDDRLRNAARPLTEVRDAKVLLGTFDELAEHAGGRPDARALRGVRKALSAHYREVRDRVLKAGDALGAAKDEVEKARDRLKGRRVGGRGWSVLGDGLRRVYRAGRDAFAEAKSDPSVENLHGWRKQAKYLCYQLEMLRPVQPAVLGELADLAHDLGDALGRDHDFAVLRQKLVDEPERFPDRAAVGGLLALIDRRRAELQGQARSLGERLYEEKPGAFADLLGDYWQAWRSEAPAEAAPSSAAEPAAAAARSSS